MDRTKILTDKIAELENLMKPLKDELHEIIHSREEEIKAKIKRCYAGKDKFNEDELIFSAVDRCACGAGLAYPDGIGMHGNWSCSDILLGYAVPGEKMHNLPYPFAFFSIKSDTQPSANGQSTRRKADTSISN